MAKIVVFSGSARKGSFNTQLADFATKIAVSAGADVEHIHLADFDLPIFNEDIETDPGTPSGATAFKAKLIAADGFIIATPEYNGFFPPLLKNAIDWATRKADGEPVLASFQDKNVLLLSASVGEGAGRRAIKRLRQQLENIRVKVAEETFSLGNASDALSGDSDFSSSPAHAELADCVKAWVAKL
jgi:chromate reductase